MNFTDAEFLTAKEKELTYKQWCQFIDWLATDKKMEDTGFDLFSKRVYQHLSLHCGFIAHYDRHGFFCTYFTCPEDTQTFFDNLVTDGGYGDTQDLTTAMIEYYQAKRGQISQGIASGIDDKLALLEECTKRAKTDPEFARQFLSSL